MTEATPLRCQFCRRERLLPYAVPPGAWVYTCPACIREYDGPRRFVSDLTRYREETRAARHQLARMRLEYSEF